MKTICVFSWVVVLSMIVALAGCGDDNYYITEAGDENGETEGVPATASEEVESFLLGTTAWENFSPLDSPGETQMSIDPEECEGELTDDGECLEDYFDGNVTYTCTTRSYSITQNPEKIVMYSPDVELLWPGALIQGKSHRDGAGSLLGLPIRERNPIKISIPALANSDNFRLVEHPDQAEAMQAIGSMVGDATGANLQTPSTISFSMRSYNSEEEFALKAGFSAKYLGFKAKASTEIDRSASERTVAVQLYEKMYEAVVEPPQTPAGFFSPDFTMEKLQEQIDLGRIDQTGNIPVYISNIVFGRMMMFTLTSTASESDIKAALNASYKALGTSAELDLSAEQKRILNEAEISVTSLGGDAAATVSMIASGDWRDYFSDEAPLSSAAPLSYTFRNLRDGSIAKVSESTNYNIKECMPDTQQFIIAEFNDESEIHERWYTPGATDPEFMKDAHSLVGGYMEASDELSDIWYFKAPIEGFLDRLSEGFDGGELSYWFKFTSTEDLNITAGSTKVCFPSLFGGGWLCIQTDIESDLLNTGNDILITGRNGITLSYGLDPSEIPTAFKGVDADIPDSTGVFSFWTKITVPLDSGNPNWRYYYPPSDEAVTPGVWLDVFSDVIGLQIRGEYLEGQDTGSLDQVRFDPPPEVDAVVVPPPQ